MKRIATNGIILRRTDYGEADRIITFLTEDYGKLHAIAKGVRKAKSKLAGGIELFSVSELHLIKGKGDIDTLVSTRLLLHYGDIVKNLEKTEIAYRMLMSIDKLTEDKTGEEYFGILRESLAALNKEGMPVILADLSFTARVLQRQGHIPDFSVDNSGNKLDPSATYTYDFESVSFRSDPAGQFNKNHIKVLRLLAHNPPHVLLAVSSIMEYSHELSPLLRSLAQQYAPS